MSDKDVQSGPSEEVPCSAHPDAPHGFNRNASHTEDRYVCDCEGWNPPAGARDAVTDSIYLRGLVGKLAQWQLRMSYNDSYFGEPAGMVKQVVAELARAVDPIYPPMPEPVDPLAGVTIYTATVPKATQPAAPGAGD